MLKVGKAVQVHRKWETFENCVVYEALEFREIGVRIRGEARNHYKAIY